VATKSDYRPGKNKDVEPRKVRRPQTNEGGGGSEGSDQDRCWDFRLVRAEPAARDLVEGVKIVGVPNSAHIEIFTPDQGFVGEVPASTARTILKALRGTGAEALKGTVLETGPTTRLRLCLA